MIKIVAVFDGLKFSEATLHHSIRLVKQQGAHLVGLFLEDFTYQSFSKYRAIAKDKLTDKEIAALEQKDAEQRKESRKRFEDVCQRERVEYSLHKEANVAYPSLIHESIYADLVIIDQAETFTPYQEEKPTQFIKDFLSATECPVLLVRSPEDIKSATLLFDGSPNSVFAIKQFSYVIRSSSNMLVDVITVKEGDESLHLPDNKLMKEFMKRHFPEANFNVLKGNVPDVEIVEHLKKENGKSVIVLGAYKRGFVSRWFKESLADALMRNVSNPLFIAHTK